MSYPSPILNLNFANAKQLVHPAVAFSRGSSGSYFDGNGILRYANNSVPRFDHDPLTGICKGLLVEPAVTFLDTYSEQFDNAAWTKTRASITPNAAAAPDGAMTADKLVEDTTESSTHKVDRYIIPSPNTAYTFCFLIKAAGRGLVFATMDAGFDGSGSLVKFDTSTGKASKTSGSATFSMTDYGGGWFLCWMSLISSASPSGAFCVIYLTNGVSNIYTGDGTSGLYIWGAKFYAGTGPTSYLPTTTAGVTRAADVCSVDLTKLTRNGSPLWTGTEGTIVVDFTVGLQVSNVRAISLHSGSSSNCIDIGILANGQLVCRSTVNSYAESYLFHGVPVANTRYKIAFAFAVNNQASSCNGGAVVTDSSCGVPSTMTLEIGSLTSALQLNSTIRSLQLYNRRLADAYLPALSTI